MGGHWGLTTNTTTNNQRNIQRSSQRQQPTTVGQNQHHPSNKTTKYPIAHNQNQPSTFGQMHPSKNKLVQKKIPICAQGVQNIRRHWPYLQTTICLFCFLWQFVRSTGGHWWHGGNVDQHPRPLGVSSVYSLWRCNYRKQYLNTKLDIQETSKELRMLSSVTINCQDCH